MAGEIVPIELGLTEGSSFTLWAPRWRDGEDEWEAFLGLGDDLYGFSTVAELVAYVRSGSDNDLADHPGWKHATTAPAETFVPVDERSYDLIAVPELAAESPTPDVIAELEDTLEIVRIIGEVCELVTVTKFFNGNPMLGAVTIGTQNFTGRDGAELWRKIGELIRRKWDDVVDAIEEVVSSPKVKASAVEKIETELTAAEEAAALAAAAAAAAADDDDDDAGDDDIDFESDDDASDEVTDDEVDDDQEDEDDQEEDDDDDDDELDDSFWGSVGIDPVKIVTSQGEYFTLRCYIDDDPIFLGKGGKIFVFTSERHLARYLVDDHDTELATVATYDEVQAAATDGSLEIEVDDENVYVLPGIVDDIADGPRRIDKDQLDLAVELLVDAADFAQDNAVREALRPTTPLGFFISYALDPKPTRLSPSAPFDNEAEAWKALEHDLEARLKTTAP